MEQVHKEQIALVEEAEKFGISSSHTHRRQEILSKSLNFRIAAVHKIATAEGSSTAGVDGMSIGTKSPEGTKIELVQWLKQQINNPKNYKASPVKRVYIPKTNGKKRPLGIPTIKDRTLQCLLNLTLLPLVEMTSDEQSYGYRPYRSAKNAIGAIRQELQTGLEKRWILDADIKGFFYNINHD